MKYTAYLTPVVGLIASLALLVPVVAEEEEADGSPAAEEEADGSPAAEEEAVEEEAAEEEAAEEEAAEEEAAEEEVAEEEVAEEEVAEEEAAEEEVAEEAPVAVPEPIDALAAYPDADDPIAAAIQAAEDAAKAAVEANKAAEESIFAAEAAAVAVEEAVMIAEAQAYAAEMAAEARDKDAEEKALAAEEAAKALEAAKLAVEEAVRLSEELSVKAATSTTESAALNNGGIISRGETLAFEGYTQKRTRGKRGEKGFLTSTFAIRNTTDKPMHRWTANLVIKGYMGIRVLSLSRGSEDELAPGASVTLEEVFNETPNPSSPYQLLVTLDQDEIEVLIEDTEAWYKLPEEPPAPPFKVAVTGPDLDAALAQNQPLIACFVNAMQAGVGLENPMVVEFSVYPDGTVQDGGIQNEPYKATDLETCVAVELHKLTFNPYSGSEEFHLLTYPFRTK